MHRLALKRVRKSAVHDVNGPILVNYLDGIDRAGRPRRKAAIKNAPAGRITAKATAYGHSLFNVASRHLGRPLTIIILEYRKPFVK
jgi:hypothetical protein